MTTDLAPLDDKTGREDKFDLILRWARDTRAEDDPKKIQLPADLKLQFDRWQLIFGLLNTGKYATTTQQINAVLQAIPGITSRTARNYLADTKRFFSVLEAPNLAFEKVCLIEELKDDMRLAKERGDLKALASFRKIYTKLIGADKEEQPVENTTILNIINFNPEQLGGQVISDEALETMMEKLLAADKKKQEDLFDDYEDVSSNAPEDPA
ncbi:hypothetical protein DYU11_21050 [Fibrisoma montanum]|uniref:Uncharacterized protein n=1 Tax=Fibrisoma montanum TaxID=2305895 RepID=A0A418M3Z4_9BACT|nr:hypothetical protein [Fibrisoma montanum]RIV20535.1 hypothetical protein DYU11_21050 [Fibrisoma montanum]